MRLRLQTLDGLLAHLRPDLLLDIAARILERLRFALLDQNEVISVSGLDRLGDLSDGRFEHHFIEFRHHLSRAECAQIAAIFARPGVVGFGLGLILEFRAGDDLRAHFFGLGESFARPSILCAPHEAARAIPASGSGCAGP